eukprot:7379904-Prymnesium_polylepis.4
MADDRCVDHEGCACMSGACGWLPARCACGVRVWVRRLLRLASQISRVSEVCRSLTWLKLYAARL